MAQVSGDTEQLTVGLDLGDRTCEICVLDGDANIVERDKVRTTEGRDTRSVRADGG